MCPARRSQRKRKASSLWSHFPETLYRIKVAQKCIECYKLCIINISNSRIAYNSQTQDYKKNGEPQIISDVCLIAKSGEQTLNISHNVRITMLFLKWTYCIVKSLQAVESKSITKLLNCLDFVYSDLLEETL